MSKYTATVLDRETLEAMLLEQGYVKQESLSYTDGNSWFNSDMFRYCGEQIEVVERDAYLYTYKYTSMTKGNDEEWHWHEKWLKDIKEVK